jgi:hypothetical protein
MDPHCISIQVQLNGPPSLKKKIRMFWNTIPNEEKLLIWKKFRDKIKELPLQDQLNEIAKFCSSMPIGSRTLDYYNSENWPTPWEILFYGSFCSSSISLLIFYTLSLMPNEKKLELLLIDDEGDIYLLPLVNNTFVLNYHLGEVSTHSEIKKSFKILKRYSQDTIKSIV